MNAGRWEQPITYETQRLGQYRTITSAREAVRALTEDWPTKSGTALDEALEACRSAIEGQTPQEAVKAAFLRAAEEADVFIR